MAWVALVMALIGVGMAVGTTLAPIDLSGLVVAAFNPLAIAAYMLLQARTAGERRGMTASEVARASGRSSSSFEVPPTVAAAVAMSGAGGYF